jgi:N-acetylmuramoyl-L-alanine amidase
VRRDLLRGAVEENLDLLADRPLGSSRRDREKRRHRLRRWLFGSAMAGALLILITSAVAVTVRPDAAVETTGFGSTAPVVGQPGGTAPGGPAEPVPSLDGATRISSVIPLSVRRVIVDPGHGGVDGGTSLEFGLLEKDLTLDIGLRLAHELELRGLAAVLTRSNDVDLDLAERAALANREKADLFVSIHVNWLPDRSARGVETYFLGPTEDPFVTRLAASENRSSGFTVADTRRLLDAIYADVRRGESRRLAEAVQGALFEVLRTENADIVDRGVMSAPFAVLVDTTMPAILSEVACLSNEREARLLAIPGYRQRIAEALARGILDYAHAMPSPAPSQGEQG